MEIKRKTNETEIQVSEAAIRQINRSGLAEVLGKRHDAGGLILI
jgi:hypothetical protein